MNGIHPKTQVLSTAKADEIGQKQEKEEETKRNPQKFRIHLRFRKKSKDRSQPDCSFKTEQRMAATISIRQHAISMSTQ